VEKVEAEGLARHCEVEGHTGPVTAIVMSEQGIYSTSHDRHLKRWKPVKDANGRYQLTEDLVVPMDGPISSLFCMGGWILCGLWSGDIKAFAQEGGDQVLRGHMKRVMAIIQHQGILMSGGLDREVRLWQMDPNSKQFNCTHTLTESIPGPVTCLKVLGSNLWVESSIFTSTVVGGLSGNLWPQTVRDGAGQVSCACYPSVAFPCSALCSAVSVCKCDAIPRLHGVRNCSSIICSGIDKASSNWPLQSTIGRWS